MENRDVFISYKAEEIKEATWLRDTLEQNGISCWMAPESIPGGSNYAVEIPRAIQSCKVFVLVLSEKAQSSPWIAKELDRAINANKIVMPFMIENCQLEDAFNFYLTNVQRYEAYESKVSALGKMIAEIRALIGANTDEQPHVNVEKPEPAPKKETKKKKAEEAPQKNKKKMNPKLKFAIFAVTVAAILFVLFGMDGLIRDTIWNAFVFISPFGRETAGASGFAAPLIASTVCTAIWFLFGMLFFLDFKSVYTKVITAVLFTFAVWYASFGVCHWFYTLPPLFSVILAIVSNIILGACIGFIFLVTALMINDK